MVGLSGLWIPILVSAVGVFIVSSLIHMVFNWHKAEYQPPPNEMALGDAMRPFNIPPGEYVMPYAPDMKAMSTPEFQERIKKGPNVMLTVRANEAPNMGKMLGLWFAYCVVVSLFVAYVTGRTNFQGVEYMTIFRVAGTTAFMAYTLGLWQNWVWMGRGTRATITATIDGLLYALVTAGVFGWLWP